MADYLSKSMEISSSSSPQSVKRKKRKAPKGILKNADPNATYHKQQEPAAPFEELVERERPRSTSSSIHLHRHHRSNKDSSEHHRKRSSSKRSSRDVDDGEDDDEEEEEENIVQEKNRRNHRHHRSSKQQHSSARQQQQQQHSGVGEETPEVDGDGKRHHSRRGSSSSSSSSKKHSGGTTHESDRIYDQPKVPAMKYLHASGSDKSGKSESSYDEVHRVYKAIVRASPDDDPADQQGLYENLLPVDEQDHHALYDVPRSNKRVSPEEEAIYVNGDPAIGLPYDVPRVQQQQQLPPLSLDLPQDYDVPKIRDSLSTIEEEQYDVPRAASDVSQHNKDEQKAAGDIYENQSTYSVPKSFAPRGDGGVIYANDRSTFSDFAHGGSSSSNDDRSSSSGYRSSSSPSLQSEELYVNESAIASMSMEDLDSCGSSHKHSSPEPLSRDIAIETTLERPRRLKESNELTSRKNNYPSNFDMERVKAKGGREAAREKERQRAEEIEREIKKKREEARNKKASAIAQFFDNRDSVSKFPMPAAAPPLTAASFIPKLDVPNDDFVTIGEIAGGAADDDLDEAAAVIAMADVVALPKPPSSASSSSLLLRPQLQIEETKSNQTTTTTEKKPQQKDRSVDVYHETIRQRVTRNETKTNTMSRDVFAASSTDSLLQPAATSTLLKKFKKGKAPGPPSEPSSAVSQEEEEMPSVRQLRSRFESSSSPSKSSSRSEVTPKKSDGFAKKFDTSGNKKSDSPYKKSEVPSKKSGFLVMSSLTRRGAANMSRSLHNISEAMKATTTPSAPVATVAELDVEVTRQKSSFSRGMVDDQSLFASSELRFGVSGFSKKPNNGALINNRLQPAATPIKKFDSQSHQRTGDAFSDELKQRPTRAEKPPAKQSYSPPKPAQPSKDIAIVDSQGRWRPVALVAQLYKLLPDLYEDEVGRNSADAAHLEGTLERLPPGKRKSTLWNNWKKQFFVVERGVLQSYSDDSKSAPIERVELFGGKVSLQDGGVLAVENRGGQYLALKCSDGDQSRTWERVIAANISQDFSRTFVTPSPLPRSPTLYTQTLVIDIGGASVRAGVASTIPTLPQLFFPSVMAVDSQSEQAKYFGLDAFADEVRSRSKLSHPMVPSHKVDKYSVDQIALQGLFEKIFKDLAVDPVDYEVQLSVPRAFSDKTKQAVAGILFEEFGVRAVNMAHQTIFAFYSYNAKSGVMVDLGERMDVVPIVDGYKVQAGVSRSAVGGKELRSKLQHFLLGRNYSLTSSFVDSYVTRLAVERLVYMSRHGLDKELDRYRQDPASIDRFVEVAPADSSCAPVHTLEMGSERFEACEGLFKPELWGLDQAGVHVLVHKAIKECSMDARREVTQSIFLAGGLTLIPGLRERLEAEVERLTTVKPRVHASPYRYHAAYLGAMVHANSKAFQETKVSKEEWDKSGSKLERYWTM